MTTFLTIIISLLVLNAMLLIFSVNGAPKKIRKSNRKTSGSTIPQLFPQEYSKPEYKKAV